jgi:diguanylate cyclase (GGDEF)-like protein
LGQFEADLALFARSYFFIDPDGIVVLTNRPADMLRTFWPLSAETRSMLTPQFGSLNDRPMVARAPADATWVALDGEQNLVRRSAAPHSGWSVLLAAPKSRIYANRISGIVITLLATMMALFYFFGREHGIRDRIQMDQRAELQELAQKLRFKATTDPLTGLYNRSKFNESLASEMARSHRYNSPLALIMFDVDHFKQVNDVYGHQTGDDVLVQLSELVSGNVRKTDLLARWGGEEFVILAPGLDGPTAYRAAEKLKAIIGQSGFDPAEAITCSFGVTQYFEGDTPGTLLERADSALYRAKVNGRNRAELSPGPGANGVASAA